MKSSMQGQADGEFREVKGELKEIAGKLSTKPELEAEGKYEENRRQSPRKDQPS